MPRIRRRLVLLGAWPWLAAAEAAPFTLEGLMAEMAAAGDRRARFVETRRFAALEGTLESRGWLSFEHGRLVKVTEGGDGERLEVDGQRIVLTSGNAPPQVIDMGMAPPLRVLIDAIRGPLSGDVAALRRGFAVSLAGVAAGWTLELVPRVAGVVRSVRLEGRQAVIDRIDVVQANGDEQTMVLSPFGS